MVLGPVVLVRLLADQPVDVVLGPMVAVRLLMDHAAGRCGAGSRGRCKATHWTSKTLAMQSNVSPVSRSVND